MKKILALLLVVVSIVCSACTQADIMSYLKEYTTNGVSKYGDYYYADIELLADCKGYTAKRVQDGGAWVVNDKLVTDEVKFVDDDGRVLYYIMSRSSSQQTELMYWCLDYIEKAELKRNKDIDLLWVGQYLLVYMTPEEVEKMMTVFSVENVSASLVVGAYIEAFIYNKSNDTWYYVPYVYDHHGIVYGWSNPFIKSYYTYFD